METKINILEEYHSNYQRINIFSNPSTCLIRKWHVLPKNNNKNDKSLERHVEAKTRIFLITSSFLLSCWRAMETGGGWPTTQAATPPPLSHPCALLSFLMIIKYNVSSLPHAIYYSFLKILNQTKHKQKYKPNKSPTWTWLHWNKILPNSNIHVCMNMTTKFIKLKIVENILKTHTQKIHLWIIISSI